MTTRTKNGHPRTSEEKLAIVEGFKNRGDQTSREYAEQFGLSPSLIYNWAKRVEEGESLDPRPPGPSPKNKGKIERAQERAHIVLSSKQPAPVKATKSPAPQLQLELEDVPPQLRAQMAMQMKIALLEEENERLRAALAAFVTRRGSN